MSDGLTITQVKLLALVCKLLIDANGHPADRIKQLDSIMGVSEMQNSYKFFNDESE